MPLSGPKINVDQSIPGTTNGVQVLSSALPAGASTAANHCEKSIGA